MRTVRRFPAPTIARSLRYRAHSSVNYTVTGVETGSKILKKTVRKLEQKLGY